MISARRKIGYIIIVCIFSIPVIFLHSCVPSFRMSSKEIDTYFTQHKINGSQHRYKADWRDIHYIQAGDTTKPLVLFVHGSPGSLTAFIDFLGDSQLLKQSLIISADRPGFGYSNFGNAEPSLQKQGEALKPILEKFSGNRPRILIGHSLGGPLIVRMAMDYPELVDGLVIVAGSIDPDLEPNETWFRAPLATPFLSWILPRSLRASNEEIYQLKPELEKMIPGWENVKCPVIVIQGKKDDLVPYENVDFARKMLTNTSVEFVIEENMNHFVPWSNPDLITNAIVRMISKSDSVKTAKLVSN
jgi:pimeloyl-ACP methyl ester carboxylesterase